MQARNAIADILPARPVRTPSVVRAGERDADFSKALAETKGTAAAARTERMGRSRQHEAQERHAPESAEGNTRGRAVEDRGRGARADEARRDTRIEARNDTRREARRDEVNGSEQDSGMQLDGSAGAGGATQGARHAGDADAAQATDAASDAVEKTTETVEPAPGTADGNAMTLPALPQAVTAATDITTDASLALTAGDAAEGGEAPADGAVQQAAAAEAAGVNPGGHAGAVPANVAGAGNTGSADAAPSDRAAQTVGLSATPALSGVSTSAQAVSGSGTAGEAAPAKADEAAKAAVHSEASQGFAAQLAQVASAKTDGQSAEAARFSPDAVQALATPQSAASGPSATSAPAPQAAQSQADAPVPLHAMAVEVGMRAMRGSKEFAIRLDPEDLGRVDIRLEISEKGEVQARLTVERVETLQLLQRDARTLERAFDQAGLKTNPDGLQFSLRDPGQQSQQNGRGSEDASRRGIGQGRGQGEPGRIDDVLPSLSALYRAPGLGALDIRI